MQNRDDLSKLAGKLGGLPVLGCRADSPAARAGIRYGDIVMTVNGMPTPDWAAYIEARALGGGDMVVEVCRAGAMMEYRFRMDSNEHVDPATLLAELIDQRIVAPPSELPPRPDPEPS
jgi:S1-C subfamily serine protease